MKKAIAVTVLSILVLVLTACGAYAGLPQPPSTGGLTASNGGSSISSTSTPMSGTSSGSTTSNGSSSSSTSSAPMNGTPTAGLSGLQLAAGTLKLAGTSNAVTPQEATQLLPLWQSLQQIESTGMPQGGMRQGGFQGTPGVLRPYPDGVQGTPGVPPQPNPTMIAMAQQAAPTMTAMMQQVTAQIGVVENAMPPAQIQAITAMNLTGQDIFTAFQQAGITMGGSGQGRFRSNGGTFTPPQGMTPPVAVTPGAFRGGGFGQGGGRMGMGNFLPPSVVTGIIQFLQKTAGS